MPLVSQMLLCARGTRGAPRGLRGSGLLRAASASAIDQALRGVFAELSVARPELGLPFRRSDLADVLLDPRADFRGDFPPISPRAAVALLCELALLDRRRDQHAPGLDAHLARIGQRVHLAMARYLYVHREQASGPVLVEPTIDPGRWVSFDLRLGPLVVVLCDALRSALLLDLERRLRDPIEVQRTPHPREAVIVDVLGCVRYRHELRRKQLRAQCLRASGHYFEYPGAVYQPLAPLRTWHWLDGFLNRHRALLDAAVRATTDEPDVVAVWSPRLENWLRGTLRAALRRSGAMQGLRRAIRASLPYSQGQLELALRLRRDPNAPLRAIDVAGLLGHEPALDTLRRESPTLLHLCATVAFANCYIRPFEPQRLRGRLYGDGLAPAGWRLLCRHGTRAYAAQIKGMDSFTDIVATAVATLNLIASCQRHGLPPPELMRQLAEIEDQNLTDEPLTPMPLLRAAWDHALALPTRHARRAFAQDAFARAVTWWRRKHEPAAIPAGCPWAWFEGQARAWEARERALCATCAAAWTGPVPGFRYEGVLVVPLESATALWDEGHALRHCAGNDDHATACLRGTERIYSLRDAGTGRRLATVSLLREPGQAWCLDQVSGFANREVTRADLLAASNELLRAANAARAVDCNDESATNGDAIGVA